MKNINCVMFVVLSLTSIFVFSNRISKVDADTDQDASISKQNTEVYDEVIPELSFTENWNLESDPTDSMWSFHLIRAKEDDAGNLYLADAGNNRVMKINPSGELVWTKGHAGHEPGNFLGLRRIDTFGEYIFIHEGWNQRIQVFKNDGVFLFMFEINEFHISDFAAGSKNHVYVADIHAENLISVFDSYGSVIETFGKRPTHHTQDVELHNHDLQVLFDVDTSGNTYMVVYANRYPDPKLRKYSASRHLEYEIGLDSSLFKWGIRKLIVGKDNNVYVVSGDNLTVYSFNSDLSLRAKTNLSRFAKTGNNVFLYDIDAAGNLLITSFSDYGDVSVSKLALEVD